MALDDPFAFAGSELVIGLVAPVGSNLGEVLRWLVDRLELFKYEIHEIRLSEFADKLEPRESYANEYERIDKLMTKGDDMRRAVKRADVLALHAANAIQQERTLAQPQPRRAYILRSLKHPAEVTTLRRIYGSGFFLMGVARSEAQRRGYLENDKGVKPEQVTSLFERDEAEDDDLGQQTRDTYHLADAFVATKEHVQRFLDLVFGEPHQTPTPDEDAMFLAFSAALRSADLSRQVGAVIVSTHGEIVATGANDVPAPGGGQYHPGRSDWRDRALGGDPNQQRRDAIIVDVTRRLVPSLKDRSNEEVLKVARETLEGSPIMDITEFHRAVHAEMHALLACARGGISVKDATLYSTTFPCHNCAKHIVAAGIKKVVYVEPYAKSQAESLHGDAIVRSERSEAPAIDKGSAGEHWRVEFVPFVGIGPRRYFDLFSMSLAAGATKRERKLAGKTKNFDRESANPRIAMLPNSYITREQLAAALLVQLTEVQGEEARSES